MLRLRQVEMFGFKSFADRTRIVFNGSGIAAVVGPNGCGKSNIADSILWVLGEQSAKTLRSGRMLDCLFNGTASRPPQNLAEVTLTLHDPDAEKPAADIAPPEPAAEASSEGPETKKPTKKNRLNLKILPGEVVVTRRLYRDGTSEYYLNGELCRLRDIQELFMGTGLGPESYAIIEQGRIGQILSSRPGDRRALLEEAAGVTRYKTKRRLAELKLESAHQNLLRVNDILEEISKQLNSLKRQAARARRYQELKGEATELRRQLLATELDRLGAAAAQLAARLDAHVAEVSACAQGLAALEREQAAAQSRQLELEASLRQEQNRAGTVLVELERAQARLADARRQREETAERLAALAARRDARVAEAAAAQAALERSQAALAKLEADLQAAAEELAALGATPQAREPITACARRFGERAQAHATEAERTLASAEQEFHARERRLEEVRQQFANAAAQQQALSELVAQRAALAEPVKKLLLGARSEGTVSTGGVEFRAVGVVADFAEFEPSYAPLLEDYLHDEMEYVVVETYDAARTGVSLLRDQVGGRATFLVDSFGRFPPNLEAAARAPEGAGLIGPVADFVRMNGALGSEAKRVLPKLARTFLVESPRAGEALARDFPHFFFLSTDGTCYHGRLVSGGVRNGHGSHALRRELDQAATQRNSMESSLRAAESDLAATAERRRLAAARLEAARQTHFAAEKFSIRLEQQEEALRLARLEQQRAAEVAAQLAAARDEHEQEEARLRAAEARLTDEISAHERELDERRHNKEAQQERLAALEAELTELRARLGERDAALRERRSELEAARERRHQHEVEAARLDADRQHAELALQSEFGLTTAQLLTETPTRLEGDALAQAELRYRDVKQRLDNLGPVNMMALEEFQECEQRHEFLTQQKDDLLASIADTQNAINEIDTVSAQQFEEAFKVINENFAQTFRTLFGGGTATLRLTEGETPADAGVDLICQPPGKRLQNVLLLSGGEKALTALALLIAIFRYQPSPFCILDEVDAPLDDTNVGRFTRLVQEMAPHTQFILITHNKRTMEVAPVLYGVTMQNAVSQIVSVRFDSPDSSEQYTAA